MIDERVDEAVKQHKLKMDWLKAHTPSSTESQQSEAEDVTAKESDINACSTVKRHWE